MKLVGRLRLTQALAKGGVYVLALVLCKHAQGADSEVPLDWNIGPIQNGAYMEGFEAATHHWATRAGFSTVVDADGVFSAEGLPVRSNAWFGSSAKVLRLETGGEVISNTFAYAETEQDVSFVDSTVYVDMRVRFETLAVEPEEGLLGAAKMALFVTGENKLVIVHKGGFYTNAVPLSSMDKWYQLTVRMHPDNTFHVLLNDTRIGEEATFTMNDENQKLSAAKFSGTGYIDELYVSHGDPAYDIQGPVSPVAELPEALRTGLTPRGVTHMNCFLEAKGAPENVSLTSDSIVQAYLLDDMKIVEGVVMAPAHALKIANINVVSPKKLEVTVYLELAQDGDEKTPKHGKINGRLQLYGNSSGGIGYHSLATAVTPDVADFVNGYATYTFDLPEDCEVSKFKAYITLTNDDRVQE